ncbi:MAG: HAD hydrolase family protein [Pseudomonadota bacterium]
MPDVQNPIVFTDLDGTLLDHETYGFDAAVPALDLLKERGVPLILASSKTAAELVSLRERMGFAHCEAIVENGAGILQPDHSAKGDDAPLQDILTILDRAPLGLHRHFSGFSQWNIEEVCIRTGLAPPDAAAAKQRQYSEVGLWSGSPGQWRDFLGYLGENGVAAQQGGRFISLSFGASKAARMTDIAENHLKRHGSAFVVALGDAPNDIAMLEAVDLGIIIPNPGHGGIAALDGEATGQIIRADRPGPEGWNRAILALIK